MVEVSLDWTPTTEYRIEYSPATESPSSALLAGLEAVTESDPLDWPPLAEAIPVQETNRVIIEGDDVTVTFTYAGLEIEIHTEGEIVIRDSDAEI